MFKIAQLWEDMSQIYSACLPEVISIGACTDVAITRESDAASTDPACWSVTLQFDWFFDAVNGEGGCWEWYVVYVVRGSEPLGCGPPCDHVGVVGGAMLCVVVCGNSSGSHVPN